MRGKQRRTCGLKLAHQRDATGNNISLVCSCCCDHVGDVVLCHHAAAAHHMFLPHVGLDRRDRSTHPQAPQVPFCNRIACLSHDAQANHTIHAAGDPASRARRSWHAQPHIRMSMSMRRQKGAMALLISLMCTLALFRAHAEVLHDSEQLPQPHNIADAHMRKLLAAARYRGLKFDIQMSGSFLYPQSTLVGKDRGAWGEHECGLPPQSAQSAATSTRSCNGCHSFTFQWQMSPITNVASLSPNFMHSQVCKPTLWMGLLPAQQASRRCQQQGGHPYASSGRLKAAVHGLGNPPGSNCCQHRRLFTKSPEHITPTTTPDPPSAIPHMCSNTPCGSLSSLPANESHVTAVDQVTCDCLCRAVLAPGSPGGLMRGHSQPPHCLALLGPLRFGRQVPTQAAGLWSHHKT